MFARRAIFATLFSVTMAGSLGLAALALAPGGYGILDLAARRLVADPAGRLASLAEKPDLLGISA